MSIATFAAGCFWGVEERFRQLEGVTATSVGYMGGQLENPSYQDVCSDTSGHAEVVQVTFDPTRVAYIDLLDLFWSGHNPTTLNQQGPDIGTQYRSAIFYHDDPQRQQAEESMRAQQQSGRWGTKAIVTQIVPAATFYPAEEYHQQYLAKRGMGSCHL